MSRFGWMRWGRRSGFPSMARPWSSGPTTGWPRAESDSWMAPTIDRTFRGCASRFRETPGALQYHGGMESFAYRSWVEISLPQIAANFRAVRDVVGAGVEVMPVVKADAYRHGAIQVSRTLAQAGARWLAVSNVEEGVILRESGITARILVMADFLPAERASLFEHNLTPVIHSLHDVREWNRLAAARNMAASYHLKIDSGMGRLGTRAPASEILETIHAAPNAKLEGLMTHFASSANYASSQTEEQMRTFSGLCEQLATGGIHPQFLHSSASTPVVYG